MPVHHDLAYKLLFSHPELVRELVGGFTPLAWIGTVSLGAFERVNPEYVSDAMAERRDDIAWRVRLGEQWLYVYILLEFQSGVDRWMALRMQVYCGLLYQDLVRRHELSPDTRLPLLLPLVLYNGMPPWHAAVELSSLIVPAPGGLAPFQASQRYCLIDQRRLDPEVLERKSELLALLFRMELAIAPEVLRELITALLAWIGADAQAPLRRAVRLWIWRRLRHARSGGAARDSPDVEVHDMNDVDMEELEREFAELADQGCLMLFNGRQAGLAEGKAEGIMEGERAALMRLLLKRFGSIPDHLSARINAATLEQTRAWFDQALDADCLDTVFAPDGFEPA